ncbi:ATP--cob(I)alamin adenosyltransferase [Terrihabitans soli]|uniref:Corrinoid adenosyltransferase n=1 Tax=Terrihabitans soli TaxID=708113 RepID=A0A6S6QYZ9_9HYPH|nr:cob(I)yrinic acid a,c-diamide adenosyltransferase [Terrihabitans soli]BCJ92261.1 ATP--cob(I)alamin adenosyltransferase [Terrihabitans soli]
MKLYTKKGDRGETALFSGRRTRKSDPHINVVGDLDELSAALGLAAIAFPAGAQDIRTIQHDLYAISALISAEGKRPELVFSDAEARRLEVIIDDVSNTLPELRDFIYPGESEASARLHMARVVARRAERGMAALNPQVPPAVSAYINRLSDLLFVWARRVDFDAGHASVPLAGPRGKA